MNWLDRLKTTLPLLITALCLLEFVLHRRSEIFCEYEAVFLSLRWVLLGCLGVWCSTFLFLTFGLKDLPLIGLLLNAMAMYFVTTRQGTGALTFLTGVTLGRAACFALKQNAECRMKKVLVHATAHSSLVTFQVGLVLFLAFSAFWHLDMTDNAYQGPRWMGLWNNPNIYGMLMGAGVVLAIGLLAASLKSKAQSPKLAEENSDSSSRSFLRSLRSFAAIKSAIRNPQSAILLVAAGMMAVGLVFSYSRGAWVGTAIGLLYLAKAHGKLKWRFVLPAILVIAAVVRFFWSATPDTSPWYVKRLDFGRPSAQHRVAAWKAALHMMWDHPLGVGWNRAEEIYAKDYSPPENGAAAITTNDYLMLGTQLGWPGLICFVTYVALRLRSPKPKVQSPKSGNDAALDIGHQTLDSSKTACRAGALAMLVAFWFDGGLFKLATASVFWILLELGSERQKLKAENGLNRKSEINQSLVPPSPGCGATSTSAATERDNE